ncbi:MAG TPA: hypothetical protein VHU85_04460 [Acidimicrobiales bacterium]|jgi:hypothetical protein|nr:hypothetical protein [Acidimicrobiales bacterium]
MRKQYHFWPGEQGLDAWDVDRLVRESAGLPVEQVPLGSINEVDSTYWFTGDVAPTVRAVVEHTRLIEEVDASYPIILSFDGRVMDGMHRVARALLEDRPTIAAVRFQSQLEPDFRNCRPEDLPY